MKTILVCLLFISHIGAAARASGCRDYFTDIEKLKTLEKSESRQAAEKLRHNIELLNFLDALQFDTGRIPTVEEAHALRKHKLAFIGQFRTEHLEKMSDSALNGLITFWIDSIVKEVGFLPGLIPKIDMKTFQKVEDGFAAADPKSEPYLLAIYTNTVAIYMFWLSDQFIAHRWQNSSEGLEALRYSLGDALLLHEYVRRKLVAAPPDKLKHVREFFNKVAQIEAEPQNDIREWEQYLRENRIPQ